MEHWELVVFFFLIAMVYGSVGFGGGSSYLAVLALYELEFQDIRATALMCNITVVTASVILYYRNDLIRWKPLIPLLVLSVPLALVGTLLPITETFFFLLLASALSLAAILMWFQPQLEERGSAKNLNPVTGATLGGGIGFLSGMVGIGGGIFLSPILHLIRWAQPKVIAAAAAVFILVNSISGLVGQISKPGFTIDWDFVLPLLLAVFIGGQVGSRLGISVFSQSTVKRATALLVLYAAVRIFIKYLFA